MRDPLLDDLPILNELGDDLRAAFARHDTGAAPQRRRPRTRKRSSMVAAAVAFVGAVVAFALALQGGDTLPAPATAALYRAAAVAQRHPLAFPEDNQFYYVRSVSGSWQIIRARPQTPVPSGRVATAPRAFAVAL